MHRSLLLLFTLFVCSTVPIYAQEQEPPPNRPIVELDFMVVQLPETEALPLLPKLRDPKQSTAAADQIVSLVAAKKATLIAWPFLATFSGQRAVVEQIDEFRYATEYDPAGKAKITETKQAEPGAPSAPTVPVDPKTPPPVENAPALVTTTDSETEGVPTSFETRNLGVTLEVEPVIGADGETISLSLVPQHVSLLKMLDIEIENKKHRNKVVVQQPEFVTNKVTTSFQVRNGDTTLLGVFKVPEPKGYIELFILHTQIKPAKK